MKNLITAVLATLSLACIQTQAGDSWDPRYSKYYECLRAAERLQTETSNCEPINPAAIDASKAATGNGCRPPFYDECIKGRCDSRKPYYQECLSTSGIQHFDVESCEADFRSKKELQIFKGKFDLSISAAQPFEILANKKLPTAREKKLISLWVSEHQRCKQLGEESDKAKFSPESLALRDKADTEMLFAATDLYAGKTSYGEFAKAQIKIHQELEANEVDLRQQLISKLQRRMQDTKEEQRRQQQIQQQRCELLKEKILLSLNTGPTLNQVRQRQNADINRAADNYAQMSPEQRASASLYRGGAGLGTAIAAMMGGVDPAQEASQQRQAALMQQVEIYNRDCHN